MKTRNTLMALALGIAFSAVAAPSSNSTPKTSPQNTPSATTTAPVRIQNQFLSATNQMLTGKIERVGKMSSQPWTKITGWHCGQSKFPTAENHQPQLVLLRVSW